MTTAVKNLHLSRVIQSGKTIVLVEKEIGSVVYPWQNLCSEIGCKLKVVTKAFGTSWTESILKAIDNVTAILAIPNVHWCDGSLIDLEVIRAAIDKMHPDKQPQLVVDGTQSIGVMPFDVQKIRPIFVACSVHKWCNAPYGMSLMYLDPAYHRQWLPLDQVLHRACSLHVYYVVLIMLLIVTFKHERGRVGSDQPAWDEQVCLQASNRNIVFLTRPLFIDGRSQVPFTGPEGFPTAFLPGARRLDAGGHANPVTIASLRSSLSLTLKWRPENLQSHLRTLTDALADKLTRYLGKRIVISPKEQRCGHILGVRLTDGDIDLHALLVTLKDHGMFVSFRGGCVRVSLYIFNTLLEVHRFAALFCQLVLSADLYEQSSKNSSDFDAPLRVMVTGCNGWLGQFVWDALLSRAATDRLDLYAAHHGDEYPSWVVRGRRVRMDLRDNASVLGAIRAVRPQVVVHLAALSSPAVCHKDSAVAMAVNSPTALTNALLSEFPQCLLIFSSTDMVYDGDSAESGGPQQYTPFDAAYPVNIYGASKLQFESHVLKLRYGVVLRLSNMVGPSCVFRRPPGGPKFLQFLHEAFMNRQFIGLKVEERRSFVHVQDVVEVISTLLSKNECRLPGWRESFGVKASSSARTLNVGGPESLSRLDLAAMLCKELGSEIVVYRMKDFKVKLDTDVSTSEGDKDDGTVAPWEVYSMLSEAPKKGELVSPKNITMDSTATEELLELRFRKLQPLLLSCLHS